MCVTVVHSQINVGMEPHAALKIVLHIMIPMNLRGDFKILIILFLIELLNLTQ